MKKKIIDKLDMFFQENPVVRGISSSTKEIKELEGQLEIKLPLDFITFINKYGGSVVRAYRIKGIHNCEIVGEDNFVELTKGYLERGYPLKKTHCVISDDGAGNPIFINAEHMILIYDHNNERFEILAESFERFIEDVLDGKIA